MDVYSMALIDTTKDDETYRRRVHEQLIDYFNIGVNEYHYPEGTKLGDEVVSTVNQLRKLVPGMTLVPYENSGYDSVMSSVQAVLVVTERDVSEKAFEVIGEARDRRLFVDLVRQS